MSEKPEEQLDLFKKPKLPRKEILFDRRKIFGPDYALKPGEEFLPKPSSESAVAEKSHPRCKRSQPYPQGYDGNPEIEDPKVE